MTTTPGPVAHLIDEFTKLPGVGPKTAQRLTFFLLRQPIEAARGLADAIVDVKERIRFCSECFNITETDPCAICADPGRDRALICVVEEPLDVLAIERTRGYKGLYHVLGGALNPIEGIGPDDLKIDALVKRLGRTGVQEVLIATNPNMDGNYTANYLGGQLHRAYPAGLRVTRLGQGLPAGGDLEYADDITLMRALEARREM